MKVLVTGIDNLSEYYDVALKQARLGRIEKALRAFQAVGASNTGMFRFLKIDLTERLKMESLFATESLWHTCHRCWLTCVPAGQATFH